MTDAEIVDPVVEAICKERSLDFELFKSRVKYSSVKEACESMQYYTFYSKNYHTIYSILKANPEFSLLEFIIKNKIETIEQFAKKFGEDKLDLSILNKEYDVRVYSCLPYCKRSNVTKELLELYEKEAFVYEY